jgi:hypothetical protein
MNRERRSNYTRGKEAWHRGMVWQARGQQHSLLAATCEGAVFPLNTSTKHTYRLCVIKQKQAINTNLESTEYVASKLGVEIHKRQQE